MKIISSLSHTEAKEFFLKGSSYYSGELPNYLSFEPILQDVDEVLAGGNHLSHKKNNPDRYPSVNYSFTANKDGRFAWRPIELIHPAIYVALVNLICSKENWALISNRLSELGKGIVECCSLPVMSMDINSDRATQIKSWWQRVEQKSLIYSLEYSHLLHTDVTDCYGSLYTHSISWALHGFDEAKQNKQKKNLLGNKIDAYIRDGRYGQTNGIPQGSVLMDFLAELVLAYVDQLITNAIGDTIDIQILRYRDDYRIFTNNDLQAENALKIVSDCLRTVGMKLSVSKTRLATNVVEGSIKPDKLAGIGLEDLGIDNARPIQKQLLRLHAFGREYPNSGALNRLIGELHSALIEEREALQDLDVQVAIATDIAVVSPSTMPIVAAILSLLISHSSEEKKIHLWKKVRKKMSRIPYNGYLEIWLQRVIQPKTLNLDFQSDEPICRIVNKESASLWDNSWIESRKLLQALDVSKIVIGSVEDAEEVIAPEEVEFFKNLSWLY